MHNMGLEAGVYERRRHDSLTGGTFEQWRTQWQEVSIYLNPRKSHITQQTDTPNTQVFDRIFDVTAVNALRRNANGMVNNICPKHQRWFLLLPPRPLRNSDKAKAWYADSTERIQELLANNSNFYEVAHEFFLDRSAMGTGCIYSEPAVPGDDWAFNFFAPEVGTYAIAEDHRYRVNVVSREVEMTLWQMGSRFGPENLAPKAREQYNLALAGQPGQFDIKKKVIHIVEPRRDHGHTKDVLDLPFVSYWADYNESHRMEEGGYPEFPYHVSRYLFWDRRMGPYGFGPGFEALPPSRQLNLMEQWADYGVELANFPRKIIPTGIGPIDFRINGSTWVDPQQWKDKAIPTTWGENKNGLQFLREHMEHKAEAIEDAFDLKYFDMYDNGELDTVRSATEILSREANNMAQFTGTHDRATSETFDPMISRAFSMALTSGYLAEPPDEVKRITESGGIQVASPKVEFTGRIATAMKMAQTGRAISFRETHKELNEEMGGKLWLNFNWHANARDAFRYNGGDPDHIYPEEQVQEQIAQMDQQEALAQEVALMEQAGKGIGSVVDKVPAEDALAAIAG